MTLATRTLRLHLLSVLGAPLPGAKVTLRLSSYQADGNDIVPLNWVLPEDPAKPGDYVAPVWPNTRNNGGTHYDMLVQASGQQLLVAILTVPAGAGEAVHTAKINAPPYPPVYSAEKAVGDANTFADASGESASRALTAVSTINEIAEGYGTVSAAAQSASNDRIAAQVARTEATVAQVAAREAQAGAENAAAAAFAAERIFTTDAQGVAATTNGQGFLLKTADPMIYLVRFNNAGIAVAGGTYAPASAARIKPVTELSYSASEFTSNGFIQTNGVYVASGGWGATGYLEILGGENYNIHSRTVGGARHAWYSKPAPDGFISAVGGNEATFQDLIVTSPTNARYVRLSAGQWPVVDAFMQGTQAAINIRKQKQVSLQHPVPMSASLVDNGGIPLPTEIAALKAAQLESALQVASLVGELDLMTDRSSPYFVNLWQYTKSWATPPSQNLVAVASRDSDSQFTVPAGGGANFIAGGALVVEDSASGAITSFVCKSVVGDVVTVVGTLPASPINAQCMFDGPQSQHLSRLAQKGLADFIIGRLQRYSYKKATFFEYHAPACGTPSPADANVYTLDGLTKRFDVVKLGAAGYGGFVPGTTNFARSCQTKTGAQYNVGTDGNGIVGSPAQYLGYGYDINSAAAGDGIEFAITAGRRTGILEIPIAARTGVYTSSVDGTNQTFDGKARLVVLGDGVTLHDQVYEAGRVHYVSVDFSGAQTLTVRLMNAENKVTALRLCGVYAYVKSSSTPSVGFFKSGDVVPHYMDSWGEFPLAIAGETKPLRADGSQADGMQFTSERLRTRLAALGISVTTPNMSKGGQTSEWGLYWVDKILALSPKPTHCIINFAINDSNSRAAYDADTDSAYDFDPASMWVNKFKSAGGKKGSTNDTRWYANMQAICDRLSNAGIKPIVLMPPSTASTSQSQSIRSNLLHKMARGFRNAA